MVVFMYRMTLLSIDQVFGDKKIDIIKKYGTKSIITDFSILLDGFVLNDFYINGGFFLKDRTGTWLSKTSYDDDNIYFVDHRGCKNYTSNLRRQSGIRPVLLWHSELNQANKKSHENIIEVNYGEYPQSIVSESKSCELEILYELDELETTGKIYTTDSARNSDSNAKFMGRDFIEYEFEGDKYIRFVTEKSYCNGNFLSDGRIIHPNNVYWVKVEPITWIVDLNKNMAITKDIIVAGIQYNNYNKINTKFEDSDMYIFLNVILVKDILPNYTISKRLYKTLNYN